VIGRLRHLFWKPKVGDRVQFRPEAVYHLPEFLHRGDSRIARTIHQVHKRPVLAMYSASLEGSRSETEYMVVVTDGKREELVRGLRKRHLRRV
jgi:hypothetical protein